MHKERFEEYKKQMTDLYFEPIICECLERAKYCIEKGYDLIKNDDLQRIEVQSVREEYVVDASLFFHRGYYNPSPAIDIIITNIKRGKKLTRLTKRSKPTHRCCFDSDDRLILIQTMYSDSYTETEYIIYEDNIIRGFVLTPRGELCCFSEEQWENGRITDYIFGTVSNGHANSLRYEKYVYDGNGLLSMDYFNIMPSTKSVQKISAHFVRKEGLLHSFCYTNTPEEKRQIIEIPIKRKA